MQAAACGLLGRPLVSAVLCHRRACFYRKKSIPAPLFSSFIFRLPFSIHHFRRLIYMHTPLVPQRITKSEFFSELRALDAAAIRSRPSNWDLNSSRPMIRRGRLTKRHPSPLSTSVSNEDVSTFRGNSKTFTHPFSSSAPPSFRINNYGMLTQENLPGTPNPDTSINTSHNLNVASSRKQRRLRDDMHTSSCFACCSGFSKK